jgi:hypothetical protein
MDSGGPTQETPVDEHAWRESETGHSSKPSPRYDGNAELHAASTRARCRQFQQLGSRRSSLRRTKAPSTPSSRASNSSWWIAASTRVSESVTLALTCNNRRINHRAQLPVDREALRRAASSPRLGGRIDLTRDPITRNCNPCEVDVPYVPLDFYAPVKPAPACDGVAHGQQRLVTLAPDLRQVHPCPSVAERRYRPERLHRSTVQRAWEPERRAPSDAP